MGEVTETVRERLLRQYETGYLDSTGEVTDRSIMYSRLSETAR